PLSKIPPDRLALWPVGHAQRLVLRLVSLVLSPAFWLTVILLLKTNLELALFFLGLAVGGQVLIAFSKGLVSRTPRWNPVKHIPGPPVRTGELIRNTARQLLSVLDTYLAALLSLS